MPTRKHSEVQIIEALKQVAARRASPPTPVAFPPGNLTNSPELAL
jgi:hypothetical protein